MKLFCCPVCAGKCDVPYGFYGGASTLKVGETRQVTDYNLLTGAIQPHNEIEALPEECRACEGKGFIVIADEQD